MSIGVFQYSFIYKNRRQPGSCLRSSPLDTKAAIPKILAFPVPHAWRPDKTFCVILTYFFFSISFSPPLLLSIFFFLENWIAFSFKNVFWVKRPITQQLLHNLQIGALVVPRQLCFASFFYSQHSSLCIQTLVYLMCRQCCLTTCMLTLDPILLNNYIRTGPFILDITECR